MLQKSDKNQLGRGEAVNVFLLRDGTTRAPWILFPLVLPLAALRLSRPPRPLPVPSVVVFVQRELVILFDVLLCSQVRFVFGFLARVAHRARGWR